jgi:hypothetical protein
MTPLQVRHLKCGSTYDVLGEAEVQLSNAGPAEFERIAEGDKLVVYRAHADGKLWLRFPVEFNDGRFETLAADQSARTPSSLLQEMSDEIDRLSRELKEAREALKVVGTLARQGRIYAAEKKLAPTLSMLEGISRYAPATS